MCTARVVTKLGRPAMAARTVRCAAESSSGPKQRPKESVWDYPRPPRLEPTDRHLKVSLNGEVVAETSRAFRVLETSHPPTYYIPLKDCTPGSVRVSPGGNTLCEWKGIATYYDVEAGGTVAARRVWGYENPTPEFSVIKDHVSFYASPFECYVDGEQVQAQPGDYYGGWITSDVTGEERGFKGGPGTWGW